MNSVCICVCVHACMHVCMCVSVFSLSKLVLDLRLIQGPVVQSVVNLMSSLRVISLTVLMDSRYNILKFFAEKM